MKIIEVIISPTGETKLQTVGFTGNSCQEASRFLEEALGAKISDKPTADFYQAQHHEQVIRQGGGQ